MLVNLAKSLVSKNIIKENTELEVLVKKNGLGSLITTKTFVTVDNIENSITPIFHCSDTEDGKNFTISSEQILNIDGMTPNRLASIYNINPDGSFKAPGKKRGRKPKKKD